jgi:hypothetical protein
VPRLKVVGDEKADGGSGRAAGDLGRGDQAALDVGGKVIDLLPPGRSHRDSEAERGVTVVLPGPHAHQLEEFDGELAAAAHFLDLESGGVEQGAVGGDALHEAGVRAERPGQRKTQCAVALAHNVVDAEHGSGFQHAANLSEQEFLVRDVHADVEPVGAIEREWRKRQIGGAAALIRDLAIESDPSRQRLGHLDVILGKVDACHPAAVDVREIAGSAADAASDVQEKGARLDVELGGEVDGRLPATDVEFVDGARSARVR